VITGIGSRIYAICSAWKGATYGVRILKRYLSMILRIINGAAKILVEFSDTGEVCEVSISRSFRRGCPELRGKCFKEYFERLGASKWPKRRPPKYRLVYLGVDEGSGLHKFRLEPAVND